MLLEDLGEQMEVTPGALGRGKKGAHDFAGGIIDGADQTQARPSALEPVMRGTINLEHHPFAGSSLPAASVFDPAALLGGTDPVGSKDTADFLTAELDLFLFFELLGQMMIVEVFVLPLR
jgi:hypothetical protein